MCFSILGSNTSHIEIEGLPKDPGQGLAGPVITGRPKSARRQDDIRPRPAFLELLGDVLGIIRYSDIPSQFDPAGPQLRAYERQVPVGGEAKEELVA